MDNKFQYVWLGILLIAVTACFLAMVLAGWVNLPLAVE